MIAICTSHISFVELLRSTALFRVFSWHRDGEAERCKWWFSILFLASPDAREVSVSIDFSVVNLLSEDTRRCQIEAQNRKWHFRAETGTFFINSYIFGAYYMISYKNMNQKAQHLEITSFTMGIRPKIVIICKNLYFFLKRNLRVIFTT